MRELNDIIKEKYTKGYIDGFTDGAKQMMDTINQYRNQCTEEFIKQFNNYIESEGFIKGEK